MASRKFNVWSADYETTEFKFESKKDYEMEKRFVCYVNFETKERLYFNLETIENVQKYKDWLLSHNTKNQARIYFHNLNFDFAFLFDDLPQGMHLDIIRSNSMLLRIQLFRFYDKVCKNGHIKKYKQVVLELRNSLSVFRTSLKELGKSLGFVKLEQDYQAKITPEYVEYCYRDCEIVIKAFEQLMDDTNERYSGFDLNLKKMPLTISSLNKKIFNWQGYEKYGKKEFIDLVYNPSITYLDERLRPFYFGGRVEVFDFNSCFDGSYNDVNSLYPYVMTNFLFPVGYIKRFECAERECWQDWNADELIFACECEYVENTDIPLVPCKINDKLIFARGHKKGFLFRQEVEMIQKCGGKITKLMAVYKCEKYIDLFSDYILPMNDLKQVSKGFLRDLAKVRMNGLYGKFGEKTEKEKIHVLKNILDLSDAELENVETMEYQGKIIHIYKEKYVADYLNVNIIIAMFITAMARLTMYDYLITAKKPYYTDTDSIVKIDDNEYEYDDVKLGMMKKEFVFDEFQALGCKEYIYKTRIALKWNVLTPYIYYPEYKYKMKGFGKNQDYESIKDFIHKYFEGKKQHRQVGFFEALNRNKKLATILVYDKYKRFLYDKRYILPDYTTRAFDLDKDNFDDMIRNNQVLINQLIMET